MAPSRDQAMPPYGCELSFYDPASSDHIQMFIDTAKVHVTSNFKCRTWKQHVLAPMTRYRTLSADMRGGEPLSKVTSPVPREGGFLSLTVSSMFVRLCEPLSPTMASKTIATPQSPQRFVNVLQRPDVSHGN
jgi:hypothetical protein